MSRDPRSCRKNPGQVGFVGIHFVLGRNRVPNSHLHPPTDARQCHLATTSLVIMSSDSKPLERFVFSTASFPIIPPSEHLTSFATLDISAVDLEEQFRAVFVRLSTLFSTLRPLPKDCTFSLVVEIKEDADPPIGHPQPWIPAIDGDGKTKGRNPEGVRTIPGRKVEARDFVMEMWIEEGREKGSFTAESNDQ